MLPIGKNSKKVCNLRRGVILSIFLVIFIILMPYLEKVYNILSKQKTKSPLFLFLLFFGGLQFFSYIFIPIPITLTFIYVVDCLFISMYLFFFLYRYYKICKKVYSSMTVKEIVKIFIYNSYLPLLVLCLLLFALFFNVNGKYYEFWGNSDTSFYTEISRNYNVAMHQGITFKTNSGFIGTEYADTSVSFQSYLTTGLYMFLGFLSPIDSLMFYNIVCPTLMATLSLYIIDYFVNKKNNRFSIYKLIIYGLFLIFYINITLIFKYMVISDNLTLAAMFAMTALVVYDSDKRNIWKVSIIILAFSFLSSTQTALTIGCVIVFLIIALFFNNLRDALLFIGISCIPLSYVIFDVSGSFWFILLGNLFCIIALVISLWKYLNKIQIKSKFILEGNIIVSNNRTILSASLIVIDIAIYVIMSLFILHFCGIDWYNYVIPMIVTFPLSLLVIFIIWHDNKIDSTIIALTLLTIVAFVLYPIYMRLPGSSSTWRVAWSSPLFSVSYSIIPFVVAFLSISSWMLSNDVVINQLDKALPKIKLHFNPKNYLIVALIGCEVLSLGAIIHDYGKPINTQTSIYGGLSKKDIEMIEDYNFSGGRTFSEINILSYNQSAYVGFSAEYTTYNSNFNLLYKSRYEDSQPWETYYDYYTYFILFNDEKEYVDFNDVLNSWYPHVTRIEQGDNISIYKNHNSKEPPGKLGGDRWRKGLEYKETKINYL